MKKFFATCIVALLLSACATAGSGKINWDNARRVQPGMTQQEVTKLVGEPYMVRTQGQDIQKLVWVHVNSFAGSESLVLTFKHGAVTEVPAIPASFK